jgi:hypothetical protein
MAQEFKIGRLRFTWAGAWTPNTTYIKDAIVSYQGKTYVCLIANTSNSTSFYNDLYYVTQSGASTPLWNLIIDGKTFTGLWTTGTTYSLGNIVIFGGQLYYCTANHTSTAFASQTSYWSKYTQFSNWHITWTASTIYGIGDVVKYGGIVYSCIANHTSASTTSLGLENDIASWKVFYSGVEYRGVWTASTRYKLNDLVKQGDNIYQCTTFNSDSAFTPANWSIWLPGQEYAPANPWSSGATYQLGDFADYGGYLYVSKTTNNLGNTPSTSTSNWTLFTQGFEFNGEWNNTTPYTVGQMVRRHGRLFSANTDNTAKDPSAYSTTFVTYVAAGSSGTLLNVSSSAGILPGMNVIGIGFTQGQTVVSISSNAVTLSAPPDSTVTLTDGQNLSFIGVNYVYWTLLIPGAYWTKTWTTNAQYVVGDIAVWQNTTYICIQNHTGIYVSGGSNNNRPDTDSTNTFWLIYVTHARKNAMNTVGDLEYYSKATSGYNALQIGTSSYVLKNVSSTPTWSTINYVPNVFYACATTGQDLPTYGTSWDQPFKTIAYACNFVGNGTLFQNTVALILANKSWILAEMVQWARYQIANNLTPYTSSYVFDSVKAARDAGYIIDAIVYDLARGGNSQTVAAAAAFFAFGQSTVFFSNAVAVDVPYYLPMLTYLGSLLNNAITQSYPAVNYQKTNGITLVISQTLGLTQAEFNINTGISGSSASAALLSYVITALTTQSTYSLPPPNTGVSVTIFAKTGTFNEPLPITVPENTAIVGDELRGTIVQPAIAISTTATASSSVTNTFTVTNVSVLANQMPVMFAAPNILSAIGTTYIGFGGVNTGQKYYAVGSTINTTTNQFSVTWLTGTYTAISAISISGTGANATFNITPSSTGSYTVTVSYAGTGYAVNNILRIPGSYISAPTLAATAMVQGVTYTIASVGTTDYTLYGASANSIGVSFTANSTIPAGTGTVNLSVNDVNLTVLSIAGNGVATVSASGSSIVQLTTYVGGNMNVYAGDSLKDMFRLRNGTGLRNMTLNGLVGTLGAIDNFLIQRPTGGSYACLDPGTGPNDTTAWIFRRSPYVQNVTAFGNGCTALKIDGTLHNGGNKSIVCNDFTHIVNDGIGIWCTGPGALTEAVSVFSYYGYSGYMAEAGGRIRATNGNSSYGVYGVIATGYDITETPATGIVFNQSSQIQASVSSAYGSLAQLLKLNFANAGSAYTSATTNLLNYSNNFIGANWTSDGNLVFSKNTLALTGNVEAWTLQGLTSGPDGSYVYQNVAIPAAGATYTNVSATGGSGSLATFNITVTSTAYIVTVNNGGSGYVGGNSLYVSGGQLGGVNSVNDCIITVSSLTGSTILNVTATGTVPINSALNYTLSLYVKQGSATSIDLQGIFSGSSTVTSSLNFNFVTGLLTPSSSGGGLTPVRYGAINQAISTTGNTVGWYRLWLTVNDTTGLNTNLQFRIYPRGYNGTAGQYAYVYAAQTELSKSTYTPNFYLEVTSTSKYTAYANLNITGAGTGVVTIADETRSASTFQTYITTDSNSITGGAGYLTASNNAQSGSNQYIQLSQSDTNTNANYTGMRVFVNSGSGAGQYGYISYFDSRTTGGTSKFAYVLKESFNSLQITGTNSGTGFFTLGSGNTSTLYLNQPVQFIPTYYTTTVTSTNSAQTSVNSAIGGVSNYFAVNSTAGMTVNMAVTFTNGTGPSAGIFSNVVAGYTYYIYAINPIINGNIIVNAIQISSSYAGTLYPLNTVNSGSMVANYIANTNYLQASTSNMVVNYPIQFTGTALGGVTDSTVYYINEVIDGNNFTLSTTLVTVTVTQTTSGSNALTTTTTGSLVPLNPIVFTSTVFDSIVDNQQYYISSVINTTQFTVSSTILKVSATATTNTLGGNLITVGDTTGFITNQPIMFIGTSWEPNIISGTIYYILAFGTQGVNGSITISQLPGQSAIQLTGGYGSMIAKTCPVAVTLSGTSGSMVGTTTNAVKTVTSSPSGSMTATFSTSLFGGSNVTIGQTYYVQSIPSVTGSTFAVSLAQGTVSGTATTASPISLQTKTGSMNVAAVGWDHINPGTQIQSVLDNTSVYFIEPRLTYSSPSFSQSPFTSAVVLGSGVNWSSIAHGAGYWIAVGKSGQTGAVSTDGQTWTSLTLPSSQAWSGIAYGNGYWIAIASGYGFAAVSKSNGAGWRTFALPSTTTWSNITYGNGIFVITATGAGVTAAAYSTNYGATWTSATLPTAANWSSVTYGNGTFVAVSSGGQLVTTQALTGGGATSPPPGNTFTVGSTSGIVNGQVVIGTGLPAGTTVTNVNSGTITVSNQFTVQGSGNYSFYSITGQSASYSTTGSSWVASTLPSSSTWSSIAYGQQTFVAVSSTATTPAYSQDGKTWYSSNISITSTAVVYGQGVFTAFNAGSTVAWTSEDCLQWDRQFVTNTNYTACAFGINNTNSYGTISTLAGQSTGNLISSGTKTKGRVSVTSGIITGISEFEPGSGYVTSPTNYTALAPSTVVTDPNVTTNALLVPRMGNGVLGSPTFYNRGNGYNSTSTVVLVTGAGYADRYQTGLTVILNNLSRLPSPGDNLTIAGVSQIYKVTSAYAVFGTAVPNLEANVSVSPAISVANATANGTAISIRTKYSQARLTNHDFLYIGSGDLVNSQYPATSNALAYPNNQTVEANYGRVFYTSTDQDGNFKVGSLFGVQQATGIITLSASQFGLTGLTTLSLGGISVGGSSVIVTQFSTDGTFSSNSDAVVPTQKAIKTYISGRLSQGGANTFTGQLTAGTVVVGGPNYIRSTIPSGTTGSVVKMVNKVNFAQVPGAGPVNIGVDGAMAALDFFIRHGTHRTER